MARIRTIKPEFPQSESMGRVSRDARLLFIQLWTLCDDSGRTRAASRMLASLLYPYDDDAPGLIDGWLAELEREACVIRYQADGQNYLQVCKWLNHQKIDKPSASKIPEFDESSRILANPLEASRPLTVGSRKGSRSREDSPEESRNGSRLTLTELPGEWVAFCRSERRDLDPAKTFDAFRDYWKAQVGAKGRKADWLATWRNWVRNQRPSAKQTSEPPVASYL
jgi:hypothetical protein